MQFLIFFKVQIGENTDMKPIMPQLNSSSDKPLYIQLYEYLRTGIFAGDIQVGEKLPSLRRLAKDLGLSVTTVEQAYNQLLVEGYVVSRPKSGYYAAQVTRTRSSSVVPSASEGGSGDAPSGTVPPAAGFDFQNYPFEEPRYRFDMDSFDFVKWKKCMAAVLNERPDLLLYESDPQGERVLRYEISRYIYTSRGVRCTPDQIVIAAGTQQLTNHLARILRRMNIGHVATEDPGYLPVQNIFRDQGFSITRVPVAEDGIAIEKLPVNIPCAVYVCPQNQFPTGAVMPVGRRYDLLEWARQGDSIILEDDYDSELRYFGRPVPALQGLDESGEHVVYLGSFSSTLFPAIKISYMVLPTRLAEIFRSFMRSYDQTCSKCEQLTLAMFMERGYYYTNIRKMRNLYASKLQAILAVLRRFAAGIVTPLNTRSGINLMLVVDTEALTGGPSGDSVPAAPGSKDASALSALAASIGLNVTPVTGLKLKAPERQCALTLYYNQIPLADIDSSIQQMLELWRTAG